MDGAADIGLVLAGGGARGAYEAGALSVLQPWLEARGERPTLAVGTSVGAINAAHFAATRHLDAELAGGDGVARWAAVGPRDVIGPILSRQAPLTLARYAGEILSLGGARVSGLLDPAPLARNLSRWIDWRALHANVAAGTVAAVAAVATEAVSGRTVAFVERAGQAPPASHTVRYAATRLGDDHLRASAAIPILFPPVRIEDGEATRGWYVDGGTRLNTPIEPALDLGARRLVVVVSDAIGPRAHECDDDCPPPDFGDGALHLLHGMLVDPLTDDLRRLAMINAFLEAGGADATAALRARYGRRPFRRVAYLLVAPRRHGVIGELATAVFRERFGGLRALRSPDMRFLNRLIGGDSPTHGELLSYLFFDPVFLRELAGLGAEDARRALAAAPGGDPWRFGASEGRSLASTG